MPPESVTAQDPPPPGDLRICVPTLLLDGRLPTEAFGHRHQRVIIQADLVQVRQRCCWPGLTVEIVARRIESEDGVIDVSGAAPELSHEVARAEASLDGTPVSPHGKAGAAGGRGSDGGTIRIVAGEMVGQLKLVANGGGGGNGQRGGNGVAPHPAADGRNGVFTHNEPPTGQFGARVVRSYGSRWYWEQAYGEKGSTALPGGNAGQQGPGGDGGAGGHIDLRWLALPASPPQTRVDGGAPGEPGAPALPGPAGKPGLGGRNLLFQYHWPWSRWQKFADDADSDVSEIVARFGLTARAQSGDGSRVGAAPDAPPPASAGTAGTAGSRQVAAAELSALCEESYLGFICESAATDVAHGNLQRARQRYQWAAALVAGAVDDERIELRQHVAGCIDSLLQQEVAAPSLA